MFHSNSDYLNDTVAAKLFLGTAIPSTLPGQATATKIYIALSFTVPTPDGGNVVEPTATEYARQPILVYPSGSAQTYAISLNLFIEGIFANLLAIQFPQPKSDWSIARLSGGGVPVLAVAVYDSLTGGNMLASGTLDQPIFADSNHPPPFFAPGGLWFGWMPQESEDGWIGSYYSTKFALGVFHGGTVVWPSIYLALCGKLPSPFSDRPSLNEPGAAEYARLGPLTTSDWQQIASGYYATNAEQTFSAAPASSWGTPPAMALVDAASGTANVIFAGKIKNPQTIPAGGQAPSFGVNGIRARLR